MYIEYSKKCFYKNLGKALKAFKQQWCTTENVVCIFSFIKVVHFELAFLLITIPRIWWLPQNCKKKKSNKTPKCILTIEFKTVLHMNYTGTKFPAFIFLGSTNYCFWKTYGKKPVLSIFGLCFVCQNETMAKCYQFLGNFILSNLRWKL